MSVNKVFLSGFVGKDPEQRAMNVVNFNLAVNEGFYGQNNEWVDKTSWYRITAFNGKTSKLADKVMKKIRKGDYLYIEGKIKTDTYENKDGQQVTSTGVTASSIDIPPKPKSAQTSRLPPKDEFDQHMENDFGAPPVTRKTATISQPIPEMGPEFDPNEEIPF